MANSVAVVYISDDQATPKTLAFRHVLHVNVRDLRLKPRTPVVMVRVFRDQSGSTFEDKFSGHDLFCLADHPDDGFRILDYDKAVGAGNKEAHETLISADPSQKVPRYKVASGLEDAFTGGFDVRLDGYDPGASDLNDLLAAAEAMDVGDPEP